ncbi:MAG: dTDP-4-amino-4,6-dideoxygalactose transaminase [Candidatus Melainabacteria bacterium]|nr:dTDP-4-amino-4,6-dideoxygalactose transaminase [Candidatus Melainabacteria bacterium]
MKSIPFNKPSFQGKELDFIIQAVQSGHISGDGLYTRKCSDYLEKKLNAKKILLTTSCTHALEMASILIDLKEGDEVIVPSYTFVSTVNAFMLRGAKPVFVDIREDTKNIDENLIEEKITNRTRAIFPVHYAGVSCNMEKIMDIAKKYNLYVVEDAAQGVGSKYNDDYLGTIGDLGCFSFHETKNIICGEGGALIINNEKFIERAEIIREKGTNRSKFFRGEVDKYTWVSLGSSYLPSDILSAFLLAQLEQMDSILAIRKKLFDKYYDSFKELEDDGFIELPRCPKNCFQNYHMFYILLPSQKRRDSLIQYLKQRDISAVFHYIPLHSSPMGESLGYVERELPITEDVSKRLLRLPFYNDMTEVEQHRVIKNLAGFFNLSVALKSPI